ncbi:MAG: rod shape-determining protein MreC [Verrucomicrobia bacterium]|nr:rod shape-determining protein MreC [Verrucomicrobiota bacterium]
MPLTLVILNLPGQTIARLRLGIGSLFLPLFGLASSTQQLADAAGDAALPRRELLKLNDGLRRENQQLRLQSMQADETARENARLRQLIGWQRQTSWKLKLAKVVLREPANWWRTIQIDLGSRDGLRLDLPVLTTDGLVGRISSVGLTRSQVTLLGDPNCKVSARVVNETRDMGVIGASGPLETDLVGLGYLSRNARLKPAQDVVTSGEGGIFPQGIPIGKIVDVQPVDYGSRAEARVKLAANLNALEEVWVMFP